MTRRVAVLAVLVGLALVVRPDGAPADLDVAIPPGLPSDWIRGLPTPVLTGSGEARRPRSKTQGSVAVIPQTQYKVPAAATGFSGITTVDMPNHLPWTRPVLSRAKAPVTLTGASSDPKDRRHYPPPPSHPLHWLAMAIILRTNLHPATISHAGSREHLVLLGQPAYVAAQRAARERVLSPLARDVLKRVGPMDASKPKIPKGKTPHESMMLRMCVSELAASHPYGPGRPFAARLRGLGLEGLAPVLQLTKHKHKFLRRNAVAMLAMYDVPQATERLRELIDDSDHVVRNRALVGLAERGDKGSVEVLLGLLGKGEGQAGLAIEAIGKAGDTTAAPKLLALMKKSRKKPDLLWSLIPSLSGCISHDDNDSPAALRELGQYLVAKPGRYKVNVPAWTVDTADSRTRAQVLYQMCLLSLARIGDQGGVEAMFEMLEGTFELPATGKLAKLERAMIKAKKRMGDIMREIRTQTGAEYQRLVNEHRALQARYRTLYAAYRKAGGGIQAGREKKRRGVVLKHVAPAARFLCLQALATREEGHAWLFKVVEDMTEWPAVRLDALRRLDMNKTGYAVQEAVPETLKRWATHLGFTSEVRSGALRQLEGLDAKKAVEAANKIVEDWLKLAPHALPSQRHWVVISALAVLGRQKASTTPQLQKVIAHAWNERKAADELRRKLERQHASMASLASKVHSVPETFEIAILELGRAGDGKGYDALRARTEEATKPGRYPAAVALGGVVGPLAARQLLVLLDDDDPWVRFGAYRSLRSRPGAPDHTCDWLYGKADDRREAIEQWTAWVEERHGEKK